MTNIPVLPAPGSPRARASRRRQPPQSDNGPKHDDAMVRSDHRRCEAVNPALSAITAAFFAALCLVTVLTVPPDAIAAVTPPPSAKSPASALVLPPGEGPVTVRAAFHLQDVNAIDESAETFEFSGVLTLVWQDPRQAFDTAEAGVAEQIYQGAFQCNEISPAWYPQIQLANMSGMYESPDVLMRVMPDGSCTLVTAINAVAESKLDLRRCPFDRQRLEAVFTVFGFDSSEVLLEAQAMPERFNGRDVRLPQWDIENVSVSTRKLQAPYAGKLGDSTAFVLTIDVRRQWFFLTRLVVLPLILIVILSWCVFWMDRASLGDRLSVSFVGLLTVVAYLLVVSDRLPQIAYVTLIHAFLSFSFLIMCCTVPVNLLVAACERKGNAALAHRIDRCCRWAIPVAYIGLISTAVAIAFLCF